HRRPSSTAPSRPTRACRAAIAACPPPLPRRRLPSARHRPRSKGWQIILAPTTPWRNLVELDGTKHSMGPSRRRIYPGVKQAQYALGAWPACSPRYFLCDCSSVLVSGDATRTFLVVVGGLTTKPERSKQCAEMLRLQRKDAKGIASYLVDSPEQSSKM